MGWSTITAAEVLQEFTPNEQTALNALHGVTTNLAAILDRTVNGARGSIQAGGNRIGVSGTIPDQLRPAVVSIARWKWLISVPSLKSLQTDARKKDAEDAEALLQLVASQKPDRPRVENPAGTSPLPSPSVSERTIKFSRDNQDGI